MHCTIERYLFVIKYVTSKPNDARNNFSMSLRSNSGSLNESSNALAPSSVCVADASNSTISEVTGTPILPIPLSMAEADPEAAGLPLTPPQRIFAPVDFELFEDGYDSDGYIPPHLVGIDCINNLDCCEVPTGSHDHSEGKNTNREISLSKFDR